MKTVSKELAQDPLFHAIVDDFSFPEVTDSGERFWKPANFSFVPLFRRMMADEALIEALRKSKGLAYVFEKTLLEINIRQEAPAGRLFYEWITHATVLEPPAKYELSPESMLLTSMTHQLGLNTTRFSPQPDPKASVIGAVHNVLQGELIDAFGCRVFEWMQRAAFKEQSKLRHKEIQSATSKTERYFGRLENNHPSLGIQRFELHYRFDSSTGIGIANNAEHFDNLIATLQNQDASGAFVGYWWKRRFLPEHGLGIHLILLIDMLQGDPITGGSQQIPEIWQRVANGSGITHELTDLDAAQNHRCWGAKGVNIAHTSRPMLQKVMKSIRLMLESEKYLRLQPHPKIAHWGMGDLPAAVIPSTAWQETIQVKSICEQAMNMKSESSNSGSPEVPHA